MIHKPLDSDHTGRHTVLQHRPARLLWFFAVIAEWISFAGAFIIISFAGFADSDVPPMLFSYLLLHVIVLVGLYRLRLFGFIAACVVAVIGVFLSYRLLPDYLVHFLLVLVLPLFVAITYGVLLRLAARIKRAPASL